jgi:hypothetical protein
LLTKSFVAAILFVASLAYGYYHYYIDTLTFAEIVGSSGNSTADIFINLFDFDTGLTRYDVNHLSEKAKVWDESWKRTEAIADPAQRQAEQNRLLAEMMKDPSFKKVAQRMLGMGARSTKSLLDILGTAHVFGIF